jgi:hypothetical protein
MYFIYDCNGVVIGNPKGYRTFRGASRQANGKTKVNNEIWTRFYVRTDKSNNFVNSIKLVA